MKHPRVLVYYVCYVIRDFRRLNVGFRSPLVRSFAVQ